MNTKEKVKEWDEILDSYENSIGFPKYNECLINEKELNEYFSMDRNVIEKLSPEERKRKSLKQRKNLPTLRTIQEKLNTKRKIIILLKKKLIAMMNPGLTPRNIIKSNMTSKKLDKKKHNL